MCCMIGKKVCDIVAKQSYGGSDQSPGETAPLKTGASGRHRITACHKPEPLLEPHLGAHWGQGTSRQGLSTGSWRDATFAL